MSDPFSAAGIGLQITIAAYRWASKTGVVDRLLKLLEGRFGETTGLSAAQLETWGDNDNFVTAIYLYKSVELREERRSYLENAVTNLVTDGGGDPDQTEAALIREVVSAVEELLPQALQDDDLVRYGIKKMAESVEAVNVKPIRLDWAPDRAKPLLDELLEKQTPEAANLEDSIGGHDRNQQLVGIVKEPPRWVREGSGLLWEAIAALLEAAGEWELALETWTGAADRPGADRARALVQASSAAAVLGNDEDCRELIARAEQVDESHPSVLLALARHADSIEERVELIDRVEPRNERDALFKILAQVAVAIEKEDFEEATKGLDDAREFDNESKRIEQLEAEMAILKDQVGWESGGSPDGLGVESAAKKFVELRDRNREVRAYRVSAAFAVKASYAFLQAGLLDAAAEVLAHDRILDEELESVDSKIGFAEPLIMMGQADRALELLPDEDSESGEARVLRAMARLTSANREDTEAAFRDLRGELNGSHAVPAAGRLLLGAAAGQLPWDEVAEKLVSDRDPQLCSVFKARYLGNQSDWREAERVLSPYTAAPPVKVELLHLSIAEGDEDRIRIRAEDLVESTEDAGMLLEGAKALLRVDEVTRATTILEGLRVKDTLPEQIRIESFRELCQIASAADRNEEVLGLTAAWLELDPESVSAGWGRTYSFSRLGRFDEAAQVVDEMGLVPMDIGHAQLACRIIHQTDASLNGLRRMIAIVDDVDGDDEQLELMLLFSTLALLEEIPEEIAERVNFEAFLEKYPETKAVQQIEAPTTADEVEAFIREMTGDRAVRITEASRLIEKGEAPSAILAAVSGHSVARLWRQMVRRPTSYGEAALDELERADAEYALGTGAIWDSTSVAMSTMLGDDHANALLGSLPVSVLAQATIDDLTEDIARLDAGKETMSVGTNEQDEAWIQITSPEDNALDASRAEAMRTTSQQMSVEPDAPPEDIGEDAEFLRGDETDTELQIRAAIAPLIVARRRRLPVFSDDRFIRIQARRMGLRAFGSQHIIEALHGRGDLGDDQRDLLRRDLFSLGTTGIYPTSEELIERCAEADFLLSPSLAQMLWDPLLLRGGDGNGLASVVDMLAAVHQDSPHEFDMWVMRIVDLLAKQIDSFSISSAGSHLIVIGFSHTIREEKEGDFLSALIKAVGWAVTGLDYWVDGLVRTDYAAARAGVLLAEMLGRRERPLIVSAMLARFIDFLDPSIRHKCRVALIPLYAQIAQAVAQIERIHRDGETTGEDA